MNLYGIEGIITIIFAIIGLIALVNFFILCSDVRQIRRLSDYQSDLLLKIGERLIDNKKD